MIFITTGVKIQTLKFDLGALGWDPKQSQEAHGDMKYQKVRHRLIQIYQ